MPGDLDGDQTGSGRGVGLLTLRVCGGDTGRQSNEKSGDYAEDQHAGYEPEHDANFRSCPFETRQPSDGWVLHFGFVTK